MSKPTTIQYTGKYANHLLREKDKEIERLNNKIEEVREWILFQQEHSMEPYIATDMLDDILEILDKVGEEE